MTLLITFHFNMRKQLTLEQYLKKGGYTLKDVEREMNSERGKKGAKSRWAKLTPEERKAHSVMMNKAKAKKLSTDAS